MFNNIIEMLLDRGKNFSQKDVYTFLSYEHGITVEKNITYNEIIYKAKEIAVYLSKRGVKKGDRIIVFSTQTYDNIYSIFGTIFAGAILTLIPPPIDKQKQERLMSVLNSSGAKFILCNDYLYKILQNTLGEKILINISNVSEDSSQYILSDISCDDIAYLQYSSGSTNIPKAVVIKNKNIFSNLKSLNEYFGSDQINTLVGWIPFYHNLGLAGMILFTIYRNHKAVIISTQDFLVSPIRWFKAISTYRADITLAPNSAYRLCSSCIKETDLEDIRLDSLRYIVNGSETINYQTLIDFSKKFEKCGLNFKAFCPGYGLAESTCFVSAVKRNPFYVSVNDNGLRKGYYEKAEEQTFSNKSITSVGKVMNGIKCIIVNPRTLKECKDSETGEIWLQSDAVADGYWNVEEETLNFFKATTNNHNGYFLRTGDLGFLFEDNLFITGRIKEIIIVNGHNVYPHDIDEALKRNLNCLSYSTICSFSTNSNEKERAIITVEINGDLDYPLVAENICKVIQREFEFSPYDVVFVKMGSLPKSDNGKIQTFKVKENYENSQLQTSFSLRAFENSKNSLVRNNKEFDEIEQFIEQVFKTILKITDDLQQSSNFFDLGGDSLDTMQLVTLLEDKYNFKMSIKDIIDDLSIRAIAQYIKGKLNPETPTIITTSKKSLYDDCVLDEDIRPSKYKEYDSKEIRNIFLTGATGFLGVHLLKDLIENTEASIYCLVRSDNPEHGFERIKRNMEYYQIWKDSYKSRIIAVRGDLSKPLIGIEEDYFNELCSTIDSIYHNGALLNFVFPYSQLRNTNVNGTVECLRLACKGRPKYFHYVSTFSVYDNPSHFKTIAYEDDTLEHSEGYFLAYTETKWVSERLVRIAESRGLKVSIYRPGDITGSTVTGIWDVNDLVSRVLVSCINMRKIPDTSVKIFITPVDFVSRALVYLSLQQSSIGKAFNLVNKNILSVQDLTNAIKEYGYNVDLIPYEQWQKTLFDSNSSNVLKILECLFVHDGNMATSIIRRYSDMESDFDTTNVTEGLRESNIHCPHVTMELLFKYLDYFRSKSYIAL